MQNISDALQKLREISLKHSRFNIASVKVAEILWMPMELIELLQNLQICCLLNIRENCAEFQLKLSGGVVKIRENWNGPSWMLMRG